MSRLWTLIASLPGLPKPLRRSIWRRMGMQIGEGTLLPASLEVRFPQNVRVGCNCSLGRNLVFGSYAPITLGDRVIVNDGCALLAGTHDVDAPSFELVPKPIEIGDYAWICTRAIILPGVRIGRGAVVGAGAVVTRDVPDLAVAAGNPARVIRYRSADALRYDPCGMSTMSAPPEVPA